MSVFTDVRKFHTFFGAPVGKKPRWLSPEATKLRHLLMDEEHQELREAMAERNMTKTADAMADLIYVIVGTAIAMGLPLERIYNVVHGFNMDKAVMPYHQPDCKLVRSENIEDPERCTCGAVLYHPNGKIKKPDNWRPPDELIRRIIMEAGYKEALND